MVALARYVCLEPIHAHTNCSPIANNPDWYSVNQADTMLIAKKNYEGNVRYVNLDTYVCIPPDQETLRSGLFPYKPKHKRLIKKLLRWVNKLT
jgi:hypothetical protein